MHNYYLFGVADVSSRGGRHQRRFQFSPASQRLSRLMMSTVDNGSDVLEISDATTFESYDDEDDDDDTYEAGEDDQEIDDDSTDISRSSLLLNALTKSTQSALDNLSKKTASLQRELEKAQKLEETSHRANLIVSNLYRLPPGTTSAEVEDWENGGEIVELVLNTRDYKSAQEESDALFALARKMKRGSKVVEELLGKSLEGEGILRDALLDLESMGVDDAQLDEGTLILVQERLERTSKKTGFKSPSLDEPSQTARSRSNNRAIKGGADRASNKPNPREFNLHPGTKFWWDATVETTRQFALNCPSLPISGCTVAVVPVRMSFSALGAGALM